MESKSSLKELENIGFVEVGHWKLKSDDELSLGKNNKNNWGKKKILYAFVVGNKVKYVGKSAPKLCKRMKLYSNADNNQKTNTRIKKKILKKLKDKKEVKIYAFYSPSLCKIGIFEVNWAAALEDSIIEKLKPAWNKQGTT